MIKTKTPIYLASKSPRRRDMLKLLNIKFNVLDISLDEKFNSSESPIKNVKRISLEKNIEAQKLVDEGIIISADTIVVQGGDIIGKPQNRKDAKKILQTLSGNTHQVYTGFTISNLKKNKILCDYEKTTVHFKSLSEKEINDYILTGSPMDKAGAYGIQDDYGAVFVKRIIGCYYNVLGFPISKIYDALKSIT